MNSIGSNFVAVALALGLGSAAWAAPSCTDAPKRDWMPEAQMKAKIAEQGYVINRFLVSGNCYEIYGKDKVGKKVEVYFNPVSGAIVKQRVG